MSSYDAIVVGAGHNGLVTAALLARAGWHVLVLERGARPGGAVLSGELTRPGFVHDAFAMNLNLFRGSAAAAELGDELERHGLAYATSSRPFANVFDGDRALRVLDPAGTLAQLEAHDPADAAGWQRLDELYARLSPALFSLYGARPSARGLLGALAEQGPALGGRGALELARLLLSSTRELGDGYMHSAEAKALLACWGMHLDFGPDVSGGALFPFLEAFTDMRTGMSIARGGASRLIDALAGVLSAAGGELRTDAEVVRVHVSSGRATGVELAGGERLTARRAVIANLTPPLLYGRLLADAAPPSLREAARRYRFGPGTMMIHLALSGAPRWRAGADLSEFAYVHIAPLLPQLADTYAHALEGLLPAEPLLVVGQPSALDPTRAPEGAVLWVQVRAVPSRILGDARSEIAARSWEQAGEPYADRVMAKLERYAPGIGELVLDRTVHSPADLERHNPNLVGGDSIAGSMHLAQNLILRPFPGVADYETGVEGLLMVGAATWPGAGVNAVSGYNVARKLLAAPRRREDARLVMGVLRGASAVGRRRRLRPRGRRA